MASVVVADKRRNTVTFEDPPFAHALFSSTAWAWLWLIVRVYVGYSWLTSGLGKLSNPAWVQTGVALKGFWERAAAVPDAPARPLIVFDWYRTFIQFLLDSGSYTWFAKLVTAGEILIGIALILGIFTGIAAFFGGFHELELHDGWDGQHQPRAVPALDPVGAGLEGGGLVGA